MKLFNHSETFENIIECHSDARQLNSTIHICCASSFAVFFFTIIESISESPIISEQTNNNNNNINKTG